MANTLSPVIGNNAQAGLTAPASGTTKTPDNLANKDTFLQLMVAQLRYQNPLNPVDGSAFLSQLSQISSVEQMVQMRQDLDSIKGLLGPTSSSSGGTASLPVSSGS